VDEVAELEQQLPGLGVGRVALGVGGLDVGGELAGLLQQLGLLVTRGLGDQLAELALLGAELAKRTPEDLRRSSADRRASTSATSSPRARWDARTRSGSSRSRRRSITWPRLPVRGYGSRLNHSDDHEKTFTWRYG
jgi:hypothetical protein